MHDTQSELQGVFPTLGEVSCGENLCLPDIVVCKGTLLILSLSYKKREADGKSPSVRMQNKSGCFLLALE